MKKTYIETFIDKYFDENGNIKEIDDSLVKEQINKSLLQGKFVNIKEVLRNIDSYLTNKNYDLARQEFDNASIKNYSNMAVAFISVAYLKALQNTKNKKLEEEINRVEYSIQKIISLSEIKETYIYLLNN